MNTLYLNTRVGLLSSEDLNNQSNDFDTQKVADEKKDWKDENDTKQIQKTVFLTHTHTHQKKSSDYGSSVIYKPV